MAFPDHVATPLGTSAVLWHRSQVSSPTRSDPVPVVTAKAIPYRDAGNRLQTLNLYLPVTAATLALIDTSVQALPQAAVVDGLPTFLVHVHGGAWRSPDVAAASIEPTVAHAFARADDCRVAAIASINYTLSPFPSDPTHPYDPVVDAHSDPTREAVHPQHLNDVLHALDLLRLLGLSDGSYVLSGHSCGACLAFQAALADPVRLGLSNAPVPPTPAAMLGVNGLYDLPG